MHSVSPAVTHTQETSFLKELEAKISHFKLYEIPSNQAAALAEIPFDFLMAVAQAKFESSAENKDTTDSRGVVRDMFLLELMSWFKNDFFTWMDTPKCPQCSKATTAIGHGSPTQAELAQSAGRVEIFTCHHCFNDNRAVARFPRYNHPAVLLKTRQGRCGEWANCFALICRGAGFEVRHVWDWTDHVWVEVFSCSLKPNRWVHVDPCENSYDSPLLYDKGWGKKLSYVIAVSQDDIQDVTWRYIQENNVREVLSRRNQIRESVLVEAIIRMRKRLQSELLSSRKDLLQARLGQELVEFLYPRTNKGVKDTELTGRESGSLAWRLARQEIGSASSASNSGFTWKINNDPSSSKSSTYMVTYDCAKDTYTVIENGLEKSRKIGWREGAFSAENVLRKVEMDWKMAYLARNELSTNKQGTISWQFALTNSDFEVHCVKISASVAIFNPSASILMTLTDEIGTVYKLVDKAEGLLEWNSDETFRKCSTITLTCILKGGEGNTGWQHAQLFRQPLLDSSANNVFRVELNIVSKINS